MNKKIIAGVGLVTALSLGLGVWFTSSSPTQEIKTTANDIKSFTIDDMSKIKNNEVYNNVGYKISFFTDVFSASGVISYVGDRDRGLANSTPITGLTSITVEVTSGSIEIYGTYPRLGSDKKYYYDAFIQYGGGSVGSVTANFGNASPDHFLIKAAGGNSATISSIAINYTCTEVTHTMTTYFYVPYKPANDVYMIIDDNHQIPSTNIRDGDWQTTPMTYVGQDKYGYHKYSYQYTSNFGEKRFVFVTYLGNNENVAYICDTSSGTPETTRLGGDVTNYCYSYTGFRQTTSNYDSFMNYPYELDGKGNSHIPTKTQFNITFSESTPIFNRVDIKTNLRLQSNYRTLTSLEKKSDRTWSCSVLAVRFNDFKLYFEMTSDEFEGTAQLCWTSNTWKAMRVYNVNDDTAVVNITINQLINASGSYAISGESITTTNCNFGQAD